MLKKLFLLISFSFIAGCNEGNNITQKVCSNQIDKNQFLISKYGQAVKIPDDFDSYIVSTGNDIYYVKYHSNDCSNYSFMKVLTITQQGLK